MKIIKYQIENIKIHWKDEKSDELEQKILEWVYDQVYELGFGENVCWYAYDEDYRKDIYVEFKFKILEIMNCD